ncbi:MAG: aminopeptidase [Lachnospiraceae bacterium]|nr:aminopeptidase [Lachnospiraceae bacterium]
MAYLNEIKEENENMLERFELVTERLKQVKNELEQIPEKFRDYFEKTASFLELVVDVYQKVADKTIEKNSLEEWSRLNRDLYMDLMPEKKLESGEKGYEHSFSNPTYATKKLGETYGKQLCFLYTELRGCVAYAFEQRVFDMTICMELFIQIYNILQEEDESSVGEIKEAIYYYVSDYCDMTIPKRVREMLDPSLSFATEIIMESDLNDLRYLYRFGEYISDNELKIATYLNGMEEDEVKAMAKTYTEGFRKGFEAARIDLSKKKNVNIRYPLGFERMVKYAIMQFREMGLEPTFYRTGVSSIHKKVNRTGYFGTSVNPQYDYDHRFDQALYLDRPLMERKLVNLRLGYEELRELASVYAGPAVIEVFGEESFQPENKTEALKLSDKQQKVSVEYQRDAGLLVNEFIPSDQYSFTIIAYPIPEIGEQFEEIFAETVKVNTLDMDMYRQIQQSMIDVLDKGDYVKVIGKGKNKTNITVQLTSLSNPEKETLFENCLADVNIPVGEVFTSPKLEGTYGLLHVTEVYLNGMKYTDLSLEFEDGKIKKYDCRNFAKDGVDTAESIAQGKALVKENIMYQNDTLPIGEFAIGTNTTAYAMGKKYGISEKLPILIAEKTGPHFAVGDTCYSMSEENRLYNPDGKEIIAKDNSCSLLRKTEIEKAYFNCHTDITIPYNELEEITVYTKDGVGTTIIKDGRFVLPGTEKLNEVLDGME